MQISVMSTVTLKPLILCCNPESGACNDPGDLCSAGFFQKPDVAVSMSSQERGALRSMASNYRVYCATDCENLTLKLNTYDLLIASPLSLNTLAKFALGIRDSFPAELLWQFSSLGKPILLDETCLPDDASAMNSHLIKVYKRHWQTLISGTIAGFRPENIDMVATKIFRAKAIEKKTVISSSSRVFITREDVITASESLEPMRVPYSAIITDIAREEAAARGVVIIQE